jgi:hypothetical protein
MGRVIGPSVKHIGIVLFPDVEELDAAGPWEILSSSTAPTRRTAMRCPAYQRQAGW